MPLYNILTTDRISLSFFAVKTIFMLSRRAHCVHGFSVGVIDLVGNARNYNTRTYGVHILEVYLAIAIIYWLLSLLLAKLVDSGEKALGRHQGIAPVRKRAASGKER